MSCTPGCLSAGGVAVAAFGVTEYDLMAVPADEFSWGHGLRSLPNEVGVSLVEGRGLVAGEFLPCTRKGQAECTSRGGLNVNGFAAVGGAPDAVGFASDAMRLAIADDDCFEGIADALEFLLAGGSDGAGAEQQAVVGASARAPADVLFGVPAGFIATSVGDVQCHGLRLDLGDSGSLFTSEAVE